jgi:glycerophosphoryl diester phosphodiesterase
LCANGIELDIHTSMSGDLMVHHDPVLAGRGAIADLDLATIRTCRLSNGEPIPTLHEALGAIGPKLEVWIEIKALPPTSDSRLFEAIDQSPRPAGCAVHSFDHRIIARLGEKRPTLRRGILSASYPVDPVAPLKAAQASVLWQEWHLIDADLVTAIHQSGGELFAWTVNQSDHAKRLAALGVDALCGNWPDRLMTW